MTAPRAAARGRDRPRGIALGLLTLALVTIGACRSGRTDVSPRRAVPGSERVDGPVMLEYLRHLSSDSLEGRKTGTRGADSARAYIERAFARAGLRTFAGGYARRFTFRSRRDSTTRTGTNVVGYIPGLASPSRYLVVSAHYDHLGVIDGQIYNGADDNASGTSALLAMAAWIARHPPRTSVILVAFDAEEQDLQGAKAFVADLPVARDSILLDVNMDMISRSAARELYVAGTHAWPALAPYVQRAAGRSSVTLRMGHDTPELPKGQDWTNSSDQGAFHAAGIPFLYFGVEDHADYHRPTDDIERVDAVFFVGAVNAILDVLLMLDAEAPYDKQH